MKHERHEDDVKTTPRALDYMNAIKKVRGWYTPEEMDDMMKKLKEYAERHNQEVLDSLG